MAGELNISTSAYSKIERGITDPSIGRITQIAKILEVDVTYFFQEQHTAAARIEDPNKPYGFATKADIEELTGMINKLKQEIASLKGGLQKTPAKPKKK